MQRDRVRGREGARAKEGGSLSPSFDPPSLGRERVRGREWESETERGRGNEEEGTRKRGQEEGAKKRKGEGRRERERGSEWEGATTQTLNTIENHKSYFLLFMHLVLISLESPYWSVKKNQQVLTSLIDYPLLCSREIAFNDTLSIERKRKRVFPVRLGLNRD